MNYFDWINELVTLLPQPLASGPFSATNPFQDVSYNAVIPRCIEYAELMMYRDPDLNFLRTRTTDASGTFTAGSRVFSIPPNNIFIVEQLAAITPAGQTNPANGTRVSFLPADLDFINVVWPQEAQTKAPTVFGPGPYFAMLDDRTIVVAPTPDQAYTVELTGIYRPTPLQQVPGSVTFLTQYLPDLFIAASMIYWSGVMKNFGAQADDPRMALSWESQYEKAKKGAAVESARQRMASVGWTAFNPTTVATPPRA